MGNFKGPAWDHQDVVFANGKNARGRSAALARVLSSHIMFILCRYIVVQKNDWEALELLEVKVVTPKCQKRSTKGSDYHEYVRNMLLEQN